MSPNERLGEVYLLLISAGRPKQTLVQTIVQSGSTVFAIQFWVFD